MQRDYPMLECCRVVLRPETAVDRPPVRLPADIMSKISVPKPYDFSLGTWLYNFGGYAHNCSFKEIESSHTYKNHSPFSCFYKNVKY